MPKATQQCISHNTDEESAGVNAREIELLTRESVACVFLVMAITHRIAYNSRMYDRLFPAGCGFFFQCEWKANVRVCQ